MTAEPPPMAAHVAPVQRSVEGMQARLYRMACDANQHPAFVPL